MAGRVRKIETSPVGTAQNVNIPEKRGAPELRMTIENKNEKREDACPSKKLDLSVVREKIDAATAHDAAQKTGPEYWRSLEELAGSAEFQEALHREFPKGASEWLDTVSRRGFLKVMGASLGLAGMTIAMR